MPPSRSKHSDHRRELAINSKYQTHSRVGSKKNLLPKTTSSYSKNQVIETTKNNQSASLKLAGAVLTWTSSSRLEPTLEVRRRKYNQQPPPKSQQLTNKYNKISSPNLLLSNKLRSRLRLKLRLNNKLLINKPPNSPPHNLLLRLLLLIILPQQLQPRKPPRPKLRLKLKLKHRPKPRLKLKLKCKNNQLNLLPLKRARSLFLIHQMSIKPPQSLLLPRH